MIYRGGDSIKQKEFLCKKCSRVYSSYHNQASCPSCHTKNKPFVVKPLYCPYCGNSAYLKHKTEVLSKEKLDMPIGKTMKSEYLYVCKNYPQCDAMVWTYPGTHIPYGILADAKLRKKRMLAHDCICTIIRLEIMSKSKVYAWLRSCLNYNKKLMHISKMDHAMCDEVINLMLKVIYMKDKRTYHKLKRKHIILTNK